MYEVPRNRRKISENIKDLYKTRFGFEIEESDWAPKQVCSSCHKMLRDQEKCKSRMKMMVPAKWKKPRNQEDCFFCNTNLSGINVKKKTSFIYADVSSLLKPIYSPVSVEGKDQTDTRITDDFERMSIDESFEEKEEEELEDKAVDSSDSSDSEYVPHYQEKSGTITQEKVNDLVRDLGLPKVSSEYLAYWLKKNTKEARGIKSSYYRDRDKEYRQYFSFDEKYSLVYCNNVSGLMNHLKAGCYIPEEWRLFIDSSTKSLKAVLLHNTNAYASIPVAHSVVMKEEYSNMKVLLEKIKYAEHQWLLCGDLKILTIILGQQSGYTKFPCFLCEWDSRDRSDHYKRKVWPSRGNFQPGSKNIKNEPLVEPSKVLLPPLHIKLGLMKQWVKALNKEGDCFKYLQEKFPKKSDAKLREGVFDGPEIRKMLRDDIFVTKMNENERAAWMSFKDVVVNFLGNHKSENYGQIVTDMVENFGKLGCLMNLKLHFLHSHLEYFPENLGDYSEEQGERFHQDIKEMERRYQGRWDINMMSDYCWTLKRDLPEKAEKRKRDPLHISFENKKVRLHK